MDLNICSGATPMAAAAASTVGMCAPGATISAARFRSRMKSARSSNASAMGGIGRGQEGRRAAHSHSMVLGGLLLTSYTTRLTPLTSLEIRLLMVARTS